jgi:glycosyltransferase involved in cell wall biosynthesis
MNHTAPTRPRLLLLAHSCNPEIGSEPGVGWNRALLAAKEFSTWVICDAETNQASIERFLSENAPISNLEFVFVASSPWEHLLRKLPGSYWLRYNLWHRRAFRIARDLHRQIKFDLVHQLNLCGFREPGYLWKLDAPFVWGPLGGAQNYPWRFLPSAGLAGAVGESVRNVLNTWQMRFGLRVGRAGRKAAMVLAATTTNGRALAPRCKSSPRVVLEVGAEPLSAQPRSFHLGEPLRVLWSGVFEHRKALHLLLEAVADLPPEVVGEVRILGRGPLAARWQKLAERLGVNGRCRWLGWIDRALTAEQYRWADLFAFTSLRDTTGTVLLESLATGTPIVCFNHQGAADVVTDDCGVRLPVTNPKDAVHRLRETILRLHRDRTELARLSVGAVHRAAEFSWDRQGARMSAIYRTVLQTHPVTAADRTSQCDSIDTSIDKPVPALCSAGDRLVSERR